MDCPTQVIRQLTHHHWRYGLEKHIKDGMPDRTFVCLTDSGWIYLIESDPIDDVSYDFKFSSYKVIDGLMISPIEDFDNLKINFAKHLEFGFIKLKSYYHKIYNKDELIAIVK